MGSIAPSEISKECISSWAQESNVQAKERKREQRLIDAADHDSGILLPVLDIAIVRERRAHPPRQKSPADSPDQSQKAVDGDVEVWFEAHAAVQDYGHGQCGDGEEGR